MKADGRSQTGSPFGRALARVRAIVTGSDGLLQRLAPGGTTADELQLDLPIRADHELGVLSIDPPRSTELTFDVALWGMPPMSSTVRFELAPDGAGSEVIVINQEVPQARW